MLSFMRFPLDQSLIVDLLLLCVAGYLVFSSVRRGCVPTFFSLVALCCTYPLACYLFPLLASFFPAPVTQRILRDAIAFAAFMGALYFLVLLLIWAMLTLAKRVLPDVADQLAAGILGLLKTVVMIVLITLVMVTYLPPQSGYIRHSVLARSLLFVVNTVAKPLPPALKEKFLQKKDGIVIEKSGPVLKK